MFAGVHPLPLLAYPGVGALEAMLAALVTLPRTLSGQTISFVEPPADDEGYEARIWRRGAVATRPGNAHDFFNALVWLNFPCAKALLNARHVAGLRRQGNAASGRRDPERDALTHFDECGAIVVARDPELLELLRRFSWRELFVDRRADVQRDMALVVFGHATLEALLRPFRGLTAKAVLLEVGDDWFAQDVGGRIADLDRRLCARIAAPEGLPPRSLQPLPVLGWPGVIGDSDEPAYYDDTFQFRPGRRARSTV